ncbi:MAG: carboxylesterase family protein [Dehalococcoidia bacterium]
MMDYWGQFAATGDPNLPGAVAWPRYDPATDSYLGIDDPSVAGAGVRTDRCDFWDGLTAGG